ncbi:MAG: hypothetical protein U0Q11_04630 [Vicinamibacterales bacterium]
MQDALAQRILAAVMGWKEDRLLAEQDVLQTLAQYKYDSYEQFEPGVKFVESLAVWLSQFEQADREQAYGFVRRHLVFISTTEMGHLVRSVYPDQIRPIVRCAAATALKCSPFALSRIEGSSAFRALLRRSLFLGLSDGARIDLFRRSSEALDNEQVHAAYEISDEKLADMGRELVKALAAAHEPDPATFRFLFLLDDFAGTGTTMLRQKGDGSWTGRLKKVSDRLRRAAELKVFDRSSLDVHVCLYVATRQALDYLDAHLPEFERSDAVWEPGRCRVHCVQELGATAAVPEGADQELDALLSKYYSPQLEDRESYKVGAAGIKYGYGKCGLPLVIHHNAPNNSLFILWKSGNGGYAFTPLFPRFERHRGLVEDDSNAAGN